MIPPTGPVAINDVNDEGRVNHERERVAEKTFREGRSRPKWKGKGRQRILISPSGRTFSLRYVHGQAVFRGEAFQQKNFPPKCAWSTTANTLFLANEGGVEREEGANAG